MSIPPAPLHIADLEAAINFWRERAPVDGSGALAPEVAALAEVYGAMAHAGAQEVPLPALPGPARSAWLAWYETLPDTPCIAVCSTSQGDEWCKGCGRSFTEVQHWLEMDPAQKRAVWRRIEREGTALRFTARYAGRAGAAAAPH
ncbi:DUF3717 domain-containing protein [Melaminivora alkalimesophila]|uniref:Uncharacterized protein n=1 Tax=Melaminivora alkalimesophila TaxID=1165852 RepID=A0A317RGW5_9BURK|nr:DUF3717 domain-containing protein [Melaminivora alkalimesophila]PWW48695.1 hypothetical protein DFR36_101201 [Melaminivora alkalimesophila]